MVNAMATAAAMASTMSIGTLMDASSVLAGGVIATGLDATGDGVGAAVGRAAAGCCRPVVLRAWPMAARRA